MSLEFVDKALHPAAWDRFLEVGLPGKSNEHYRYVRLKELYSHPYALPTLETIPFSPQKGTLVFVNGTYVELLSLPPKGVIALPLSKAFATYGSFLNARLNKWTKEESDPFALLNGAYYREGLFLYLPPQALLSEPLTILHLVSVDQKQVHHSPRIHLFAGKQAMAQLLLKEQSAESHLVNGFFDCALEEGAQVTLMKGGALSEKGHHLWSLRATLKKNSGLKTISVTNGAATSREDYRVRLLGEDAEANLYGVWKLSGNRQHHVNLQLDHEEPNGNSLQKFKGVLSDMSRSSFEGKIFVHRQAQKTQAYQMNNNLLIGERATAYSKPNLEILADDVKASHGATVGQLDAEQLFYLMARGIPLPVAQRLLLLGFTRDVVDLIPDTNFRKEALQLIV